jgi:soluble lytic murein transglycosylase-like protein
MPDELEFGERLNDTRYGVRHGGDRRARDRRNGTRATRNRRRRQRRQAGLRSLLLAAAALATSHSVRTQTAPLRPNVAVSMQDFRALEPARPYDELIAEAAEAYNLDPELIRAVMRAESAFDPLALSRAGAQGLMQLMPALAAEMGVDDPFDPRQNIMGGARYLRRLLDRHKGNVPLSLASYNAGPTAVARYKAIPPFKETRQYVKKITGFLADAHEEATNE